MILFCKLCSETAINKMTLGGDKPTLSFHNIKNRTYKIIAIQMETPEEKRDFFLQFDKIENDWDYSRSNYSGRVYCINCYKYQYSRRDIMIFYKKEFIKGLLLHVYRYESKAVNFLKMIAKTEQCILINYDEYIEQQKQIDKIERAAKVKNFIKKLLGLNILASETQKFES